MHFPYRFNRPLLALSFLALIVGHPAWVHAYKELPIGTKLQSSSGIRNFRTRKNNVLRGTDPLSQYGNDMLAYYRQYLLPALTREDQRDNWDSLRKELISDLMNATDAKARLEVLRLVWKYCNGIVPNEQYHPAARYNFLLLLGQLNQKEASGSTPPVPLSKQVLPKLMEPFQKEGYPPLLQYAAILGIVRHAELTGHPKSPAPMKAADQEKLVQLMIQVATQAEAPKGVDASAHDWLRTRAVEVLGNLYLGSEDVVDTLASLLVDKNAGLDVRCQAATTLGKLSGQIDGSRVEDLVGRLTKLTYDCVRAEFDILAQQAGNRNTRIDSGPRRTWEQDPGADSSGRGQVEIADPRTTPTRRRLLFQLLAVQDGLIGNNSQGIAGLDQLAGAADHVEPLKSELTKLIDALQDVESQYEKLGAIIQIAAREELPAMVPEELKGRAPKAEEDAPEQSIDVADAGQPR